MNAPSNRQAGDDAPLYAGAESPQELRFYPRHTRRFAGEPSRLDFAIRYAGDDCGEGLVALRGFAAGEIVFVFTGAVVHEVTQYTLQIDTNLHIHDPYVMGKVLHHCAPNCRVAVARRAFIAIRSIAAGDFVTMDYCQTEDVLFKSFACRCGAPQCRAVIRGRRSPAGLIPTENG